MKILAMILVYCAANYVSFKFGQRIGAAKLIRSLMEVTPDELDEAINDTLLTLGFTEPVPGNAENVNNIENPIKNTLQSEQEES